jgi:ATP-binding cassette subfamily B protein
LQPHLILIVAGARFAYNRIYVYRQERRRATGRVVGFIAETFGAIQAVQVAGAEKHVLQHFDELNHIREKATLREVLFDGMLDAMFRNAVSIGTAIMMFMVHKQAMAGDIKAGDVSYFVYSLGAISELLGELRDFYRPSATIARLDPATRKYWSWVTRRTVVPRRHYPRPNAVATLGAITGA